MQSRIFSHLKKGNAAFATTWLDLKVIVLSKISQKENAICSHSDVDSKIPKFKQNRWDWWLGNNGRYGQGYKLPFKAESVLRISVWHGDIINTVLYK